MQIDFHHGVIYVLARLAGFEKRDADIIAYCSQYVDDATLNVPIRFLDGALYKPLQSAHKMLDYRNFNDLAYSLVWIPFHFLPGNGNLTASEGKELDYVKRIICRKNSPLAQDMIRDCIEKKSETTGLYRFGIALHTYADTWAHQGFAGIQSEVNKVKYLRRNKIDEKLIDKLSTFFGSNFDKAQGIFLNAALPLGHGTVLSYPDRPYLTWSYEDHQGSEILKNNPEIYMEAVDHIYEAMKRYLIDNPYADVEGVPSEERKKIEDYLRTIDFTSGEERHREWLKLIREGKFSFGPEYVSYASDGRGSWEFEITNGYDVETDIINSHKFFETSHWRYFYDAIRDHYYFLLRKLFPKYGLLIA
ncbi:DUF6765 family protein [Heliorestis convoluta]|uniref:Uncharacterized protein n=1 Tax=Heliorestis convoluta TaxID=356322 RepID=A0A5Q2MVQ0_9FIRM|nr:DUF6765 family protein [Heliorestis convoluta]QGG46314.1 hypothetical protein FTV88_0135 [Heliorestis convoluta]